MLMQIWSMWTSGIIAISYLYWLLSICILYIESLLEQSNTFAFMEDTENMNYIKVKHCATKR